MDDVNPLDVLVIGAGFSGVCAGIKLLEEGITHFRIYEKSDGIGGTWHDNTYPGAACDVPSHMYCYSFEPNPNWSRVYSPQQEIREYIERCVDKYGLRDKLVHGKAVEKLVLDETTGLWNTHFADGDTVQARHIINGSGGLHVPAMPDIPGVDRFQGDAMHTARWNHDVDFEGKRIAVIGSAASAIQVVPELAKVASHLIVFQRTPNYIAPRMDRAYTEREKRRFARWPGYGYLYRLFIFLRMEFLLFPLTKPNSRFGRRATKRLQAYIRMMVNDPDLQDDLTPEYELGCKRILISDDYYSTLNRENVSVVTRGIDSIESRGIRDIDEEFHEVDAIIYATGFDIEKHMMSIEVIGKGGKSLGDYWTQCPEAYNGACVADFPNHYFVTGPNTGVATTSVVYMVEQQIHFILRAIEVAGSNTLMSVTQAAQDEYNSRIQADLANSVWASGCKSWYIREDGRILTLYPYNARTFRHQCRELRIEDFERTPISQS